MVGINQITSYRDEQTVAWVPPCTWCSLVLAFSLWIETFSLKTYLRTATANELSVR